MLDRSIPRRWRAAAVVAAAFCLVAPGAAHAHDPGLSFLDVRVTAQRIEATLSLSAADAKVAIGDTAGSLDAFASQSLVIRSDGIVLRGRIEARSMDEDAAIVRVSFEGAAGSRVAIASDVPRRLAVGHRELVTVRRTNGSVLAERMIGAHDAETAIDLGPAPRAGVLVPVLLAGIAIAIAGLCFLRAKRSTLSEAAMLLRSPPVRSR